MKIPGRTDTLEGGRRERHKAATRAALADSALSLVSLRGWDEVTVADIAAAADVAPRTFYRYFTGKEDAVLMGLAEFFDGYVALVAARPTDEPPMRSLVAALDDAADIYRQGGMEFSVKFLEGFTLVATVPAIAARQHYVALEAQDRVTALFADRLGVPDTALEPRMFAAASTAAYQAATRTWVDLPADQRNAARVFELAREALEAYANGLDRMVVPGIG